MKYKVLGPRILVKVKKFDKNKDEKFAGSSIIMAAQTTEMETITQTIGEIVQIGPTALTEYTGFEDLKVGDKVHFQRYGAMRVGVKDSNDMEHWIINGKDVLCIELEEIQEVVND